MTSKHIYPSKVDIILFWAFNLFGSYFILGSLYAVFVVAQNNSFLERFSIFMFFLIFGLGFLFFANMFPEIVSDERGLAVRFFLWHMKVKWEDVGEVKQMPLMSFLSGTSRYMVKTKSLTHFYRFYGLYGLSFMPSFLIKSNITEFDLLKERLEKRRT